MLRGPLTKDALFEFVLDVSDAAPGVAKAKRLLLKDVTRERLELVWDKMNSQIHKQLGMGKGVNIASFGKFGQNRADDGNLTLSLCDNFVRVFNVQIIRLPVSFGTMLELNYTMLSLETKVPKEEVRAIISQVFSTIGERISANKQPLMIDFGPLGTLYADHRRIQFAFGEKNGNGREGGGNAAFSKFAPESAKSLELVGSGKEERKILSFGAGSMIAEDKMSDTAQETSSQSSWAVPKLRLSEREVPISRPQTASSNASSDSSKRIGSVLRQSATMEDDGTPIVYPVFLSRDPRSPKKQYRPSEERVEFRSRKLEGAMDLAFQRMEDSLVKEAQRIKEEESEINKRNELSEMAYQDKLLRAKREQLEMNSILMEQAKERHEREARERTNLRNAKLMEEYDGKVPFPIEKDLDFVGAEMGKMRLRKALQYQMKEKTKRQNEDRTHSVAEERFLNDCNLKLLQADRYEQKNRKQEERRILQSSWERQKKLADMQKKLVESKNGKLLNQVMSQDSLLAFQ